MEVVENRSDGPDHAVCLSHSDEFSQCVWLYDGVVVEEPNVFRAVVKCMANSKIVASTETQISLAFDDLEVRQRGSNTAHGIVCRTVVNQQEGYVVVEICVEGFETLERIRPSVPIDDDAEHMRGFGNYHTYRIRRRLTEGVASSYFVDL